MKELAQVSDNNFIEVITGHENVLIIFSSQESKDKYKVTSVPVFKLFKEGEVVYTGFGVRESNDLYYQLSSFL
ncbi:hypothetical protein JCM16358_12110 [Halanaerocella petrolearia]